MDVRTPAVKVASLMCCAIIAILVLSGELNIFLAALPLALLLALLALWLRPSA